MAKPLELELAFYLEKKPELLRTHPGQFVLIKGREIVGIYPSQNDAYVVGFSRFIREPFLVKHIVENEPTEQVTTARFAPATCLLSLVTTGLRKVAVPIQNVSVALARRFKYKFRSQSNWRRRLRRQDSRYPPRMWDWG